MFKRYKVGRGSLSTSTMQINSISSITDNHDPGPQGKDQASATEASAISSQRNQAGSNTATGEWPARWRKDSVGNIMKEQQTRKGQVKDTLKILALISPQVITLAVVCALVIIEAQVVMESSKSLKEHVQWMKPVRNVITKLQRERQMTCLIQSKHLNQNSVYELAVLRSDSDVALDNVNVWLADGSDGADMITKHEFRRSLNHFRAQSSMGTFFNCSDTIDWYTSHIDKLLIQIERIFRDTKDGELWNLVASKISLLKVKDLIGIKIAMGAEFFSGVAFDEKKMRTFEHISGGAESLWKTTVMAAPESLEHFKDISQNDPQLFETLQNLENIMESNSREGNQNNEESLAWITNMTAYMDILTQVEHKTTDRILHMINKDYGQSRSLYMIVVVVVCATAIISPLSIAGYLYKADKLQKRIVLYQMLPVSIANDLKAKKSVQPEEYEQVTLFFSDIMGFTTLSGRSSPIQIIELLNKLYTECDAILDKYDVYKVETIGDAYMVASGLPKRNGHQHSNEICTMALDVLQMMEDFRIPHMPQQKLLMRIGIHTGPCAAGIAGTKMPRYCLFGDTVNTASRMESSGMAMQIHLSEAVDEHLSVYHEREFQTVLRGQSPVKGKGLMTTYWLLGKQNFPYKVDLENAERLVRTNTYWMSV